MSIGRMNTLTTVDGTKVITVADIIQQVDVSNIANYPIATEQQSIDAVSNTVYTTPLGVRNFTEQGVFSRSSYTLSSPNSTEFVLSFNDLGELLINSIQIDTDDVVEGGSLYFTDARSRSSLSASGDISYDNVTGIISFSETYSTPAEIKTAYESNVNTNAFTDAEKAIVADSLLGANNLSDVDSPLTAFNTIKQAATTISSGVVTLGTDAGDVPTNADLGTAATENITTSTKSITAGELLKVGDDINFQRLIDFGLYFPTATATNIDNAVVGDVGLYESTNPGTYPVGASFWWITTQKQYTNDALIQEATSYNQSLSTLSPIQATRLKSGGGTWSSWVYTYSTGNNATSTEVISGTVDNKPTTPLSVNTAIKRYGGEYTPDIKPTIDWDFSEADLSLRDRDGLIQGPFIDLATTTRGSTATYVDAIGLVRTAAIDQPRYTFDPETGESLGLLVEEQRTNQILHSESFDDAVWTKGTTTVTPNTIAAPDGVLSADLIEKPAASNIAIRQEIVATLGSYSASVWVKKGSLSKVSFIIFENGTTTTLARGVVDLNNGTVVNNVGTIVTKSYPDGWYRLSTDFTVNNTSLSMFIYPDDLSNSVAGNIYAWGAQLEPGSFPTSYIPTTTAQVTRSADNIFRTIGDEYNSEEGTALITIPNDTPVTKGYFIEIYESVNDRIVIRKDGIDGAGGFFIRAAVQESEFLISGLDFTKPVMLAISYSQNNFIFSASGSSVSGAISGGILPTAIYLGSSIGRYMNSNIADVKYFPKALSATELEDMTR